MRQHPVQERSVDSKAKIVVNPQQNQTDVGRYRYGSRATADIAQGELAMEASFRLIALQAEPDLRSLALRHVENCIVTTLDPTLTWFLIQTRTDAERDLLTGNETLAMQFRQVFRSRGCPDALVRDLAFTFESQETVDRDYVGNWYWALK